MSKSTLAINGGTPVRATPFPAYNIIGEDEIAASEKVLRSGVLSKFLAKWSPDFFGGPVVKEFEASWGELHGGAKHTLSFNSATSGLYAAIGALGIGPGDEVIVSPYTMSASAAAILVYNAIPVFADIQDDIFNLDPKSVEARVTERTKAIMVPHIFGHPADMDGLRDVARRHGLKIVEDAAQAPYTRYKGQFAGTIGDIGVFSLNYHKHIHTGEGGMVCTEDDELAERLALIRNHAEVALTARGLDNLVNMIGFNYRLTEMQAAIGLSLTPKLPGLVEAHRANAKYLADRIGALDGITPPKVYDDCEHAYYVQSFKYDAEVVGVSRKAFIEAVRAELPSTELREVQGPLLFEGYAPPLYWQKMYQERIVYGDKGCPFTCQYYGGSVDYSRGICPVVERMHTKELFFHEMLRPPMTEADLNNVASAFEKVFEARDQIVEAAAE